MALKFAQGVKGLDGELVPVQKGPPPAPPTREIMPAPEVPDLRPLSELYPGQAPAFTIEITDRERDILIAASGNTMDEAIQDAVAQYEAAQPVKPLVFLAEDGVRNLDPMTRSILTEALILFEASASGQGAPQATMTMLARVKASVTGDV